MEPTPSSSVPTWMKACFKCDECVDQIPTYVAGAGCILSVGCGIGGGFGVLSSVQQLSAFLCNSAVHAVSYFKLRNNHQMAQLNATVAAASATQAVASTAINGLQQEREEERKEVAVMLTDINKTSKEQEVLQAELGTLLGRLEKVKITSDEQTESITELDEIAKKIATMSSIDIVSRELLNQYGHVLGLFFEKSKLLSETAHKMKEALADSKKQNLLLTQQLADIRNNKRDSNSSAISAIERHGQQLQELRLALQQVEATIVASPTNKKDN